MFRKTVLILEGPAGSGKTTLIDRFEQRGFPVVKSSLSSLQKEKREFKTRWACYNSAVNDYLKSVQLFECFNQGYDAGFVLIDRLILSQIVYNSIRLESIPLEIDYDGYTQNLFAEIHQALMLRAGLSPEIGVLTALEIDLHWIILLPDAKSLQQRRDNHPEKRNYPYSAKEEINQYKKLSEMLMRFGANVLSISGRFLPEDCEDQINKIVGAPLTRAPLPVKGALRNGY